MIYFYLCSEVRLGMWWSLKLTRIKKDLDGIWLYFKEDSSALCTWRINLVFEEDYGVRSLLSTISFTIFCVYLVLLTCSM
ncbi:hypothetical protein Hdeb2414_s0016g00494991 [Helianthus debilis subsp. tardiflorus]